MSVPPRSPRLLDLAQQLLVAFDVSCGDGLMPGHTLVVRGLADQGRSRDDLSSGDQSMHDECQMVDLVYELLPGVALSEAPVEKSQPYTVDATYDTRTCPCLGRRAAPARTAWAGRAGSRSTRAGRARLVASGRGRCPTARGN